MLPVTFLQFLSFICSNLNFSNLKIFYYYKNILYGFEGSKRIFAYPCLEKKERDFHWNFISNLIKELVLSQNLQVSNLG